MTVAELAKASKTTIKVFSGRTGRVLCHRFVAETHEKIGNTETDCVWADLRIIDSIFGKHAEAIICCYVPWED